MNLPLFPPSPLPSPPPHPPSSSSSSLLGNNPADGVPRMNSRLKADERILEDAYLGGGGWERRWVVVGGWKEEA